MIVVMKPGATKKQVAHVVDLVREYGLKDHVIYGTDRTVVACIGDKRMVDGVRCSMSTDCRGDACGLLQQFTGPKTHDRVKKSMNAVAAAQSMRYAEVAADN